jgi:hypothetical protein
MKNLLILLIASGFWGSIYAQDTQIAIAIGLKRYNCGSNYYYSHEGFAWYYGVDYGDIVKKAREAVRNNFPSSEDVYTDVQVGNYLVIISTDIKYQTCGRLTFGYGIGVDRSSALSKAKTRLHGENWRWNESDGYKIVVDKSVN